MKAKILLISSILVFCHLFDFILIPIFYYRVFEALFLLYFAFEVITKRKKTNSRMNFRGIIIVIMSLPFLSSIMAYFYHDQPFIISFYELRFQLLWLFYFVLHYYKVKENDIIYVIKALSIIWCFLNIFQQFSYPHYWFYFRGEDSIVDTSVEVRSGLYRYMISGISLVLISLFHVYEKILMKFKIKYLLFFLLMLAGIYIFQTRQIIISAILVLFITPFLKNEKYNFKTPPILFVLVIGFLLYLTYDVLFSELLAQTVKDKDESSRYLSYEFFGLHYWPSVLCVIFGNGIESIHSDYGKELFKYADTLWVFRSDVGIVGILNQYGLVYVVSYIALIIKLFGKFKNIPNYLKSYLISTLIIIPLIFTYVDSFGILVFATFLYLVDINSNLKKDTR